MRRLWPTSLAGQIALAVALALLLAQLINFAWLIGERERRVLTQSSAPVIARLVEAIERDAAGAPMRGWRGRRGVIVDARSPITPRMRARPDVAARAREVLGEVGLSAARVEAAESSMPPAGRPALLARRLAGRERGGFLIVAAEVRSGRWVSAFGRLPPRPPRLFGWLTFATLLLYALVLLPVLWIVRRLARPIGDLTRAAETFRDAGSSVTVAERGPADVRRLIAAQNAMQARIAGLLDEKDRMLGAIGHDLRTPLASLRVRAEGVEDEAERARMAATIDEMSRTLDDILSLARLGRPREAVTRVDLGALLEQVVDDFEVLGADVSLTDGARVTLPLRPTLIARALRNLIDNAVHYAGAARIGFARDGAGVAITIDDDGPGIAAERIEDMFEPFVRLEESRNRETGGAGLGLALARAIARQHEGDVTLANRVEGGLRATLWLPVEAQRQSPTG